MTTTVRISAEAHSKLKSLAMESGHSMPAVLERAIEAYRRQQLLEEANRAFEQSQDHPYDLDERREWEATLGDGLDSEVAGDHQS